MDTYPISLPNLITSVLYLLRPLLLPLLPTHPSSTYTTLTYIEHPRRSCESQFVSSGQDEAPSTYIVPNTPSENTAAEIPLLLKTRHFSGEVFGSEARVGTRVTNQYWVDLAGEVKDLEHARMGARRRAMSLHRGRDG